MNIPLFKIFWDDEDIRAVNSVIERGSFWTTGPTVDEFERKISDYIGSKYCVTFNSGTSALHSVLLAYGLGENAEVIVPSFTFIATANAPLFIGAKPVFADIEEKTLGLNPENVLEKITEKTKAIIPVHYGGSPCFIDELNDIADDYDLLLIEDAAESFGGMVNGRKVGTYGDSAMFSFCQNKIITTGDGGCIVTDSKEVYDKLKLIRSHGRHETSNYFSSTELMDYVALGYNFRMSDITAALGISQISKTDTLIEMRRRNARYMTDRLSSIGEIILPTPSSDYFHVYQMYTIRVKGGVRTRDNLMRYLSGKGVGTKVYFSPVHLTQFYRSKFGHMSGELPSTEKMANQVLSLPMFPTIAREEIDYIGETIGDFFSTV